eukprot:jgi/Hompol1/2268/HPOL_002873-RA
MPREYARQRTLAAIGAIEAISRSSSSSSSSNLYLDRHNSADSRGAQTSGSASGSGADSVAVAALGIASDPRTLLQPLDPRAEFPPQTSHLLRAGLETALGTGTGIGTQVSTRAAAAGLDRAATRWRPAAAPESDALIRLASPSLDSPPSAPSHPTQTSTTATSPRIIKRLGVIAEQLLDTAAHGPVLDSLLTSCRARFRRLPSFGGGGIPLARRTSAGGELIYRCSLPFMTRSFAETIDPRGRPMITQESNPGSGLNLLQSGSKHDDMRSFAVALRWWGMFHPTPFHWHVELPAAVMVEQLRNIVRDMARRNAIVAQVAKLLYPAHAQSDLPQMLQPMQSVVAIVEKQHAVVMGDMWASFIEDEKFSHGNPVNYLSPMLPISSDSDRTAAVNTILARAGIRDTLLQSDTIGEFPSVTLSRSSRSSVSDSETMTASFVPKGHGNIVTIAASTNSKPPTSHSIASSPAVTRHISKPPSVPPTPYSKPQAASEPQPVINKSKSNFKLID